MTATSTAASPYRPPEHRISFAGLLRSEWLKFWSIRSTVVVLAVAVLVTVGTGLLITGLTASLPADEGGGGSYDVSIALVGLQLAGLLVAAVGAIAIGNEYASGSIRSTLVVAPRRLPVLAAKLVVVAAIVLAVFAVTVAITVGVGQAVLAGGGASLELSAPGTTRAIVGNLVVLVGIAWSGLGLAALIRNSAAAICIVIGLLFVLPLLLLALPEFGARELILNYTFAAAATAVTAPGDGSFGGPGPLGGAVAFTVWVLGFVAAGATALVRRDA